MKKTSSSPIPSEVYRVSEMPQGMVQDMPIGTNLALYEGLMTLMSGALSAQQAYRAVPSLAPGPSTA